MAESSGPGNIAASSPGKAQSKLAMKSAARRAIKKGQDEAIVDKFNSLRAQLNLPRVTLTFTHTIPFKNQSCPSYDPPPEMLASMNKEDVSKWKKLESKKRKAANQKANRERRKQLMNQIKTQMPELERQVASLNRDSKVKFDIKRKLVAEPQMKKNKILRQTGIVVSKNESSKIPGAPLPKLTLDRSKPAAVLEETLQPLEIEQIQPGKILNTQLMGQINGDKERNVNKSAEEIEQFNYALGADTKCDLGQGSASSLDSAILNLLDPETINDVATPTSVTLLGNKDGNGLEDFGSSKKVSSEENDLDIVTGNAKTGFNSVASPPVWTTVSSGWDANDLEHISMHANVDDLFPEIEDLGFSWHQTY